MNTFNFIVMWPSSDYTETFTEEAPTVGEASTMLATKLHVRSRSAGRLIATCKDDGIARRYELIDGQSYDDHLNAECRIKGAPTECRGCPRGQRQRAEYAQGA